MTVPYSSDWTLDFNALAVPGLKLIYIANPDSPSGTAMPRERVAELLRTVDCPVLVDEAYADFADPRYHSIPLLREHPNLIVSRSFSKGYSLAGIRMGYLAASPEMVEHLVKVKDSYNCDLLSQVAGVAALDDQGYLAETRSKVQATRAGSRPLSVASATKSRTASPTSSGRRAARRRERRSGSSRTAGSWSG